MEKRETKPTQDGSNTLFIPEWNEHYHSSHGALQEALHVFIENGFHKIERQDFTVVEYGFGTGLNAFLTAIEASKSNRNIRYIGLEKYPVNFEELGALNYNKIIEDNEDYFGKMHRAQWNRFLPINANIFLKKIQEDFRLYSFEEKIDLVYFDAFGYRVQPHLWSEEIFQTIYNAMNTGGLFTTYSSKGLVRRSLQNIGFEVEKIPGPKGKREMLNAWKS